MQATLDRQPPTAIAARLGRSTGSGSPLMGAAATLRALGCALLSLLGAYRH